ncbi:hypothetical protein FACS1894201_08000 [Bacteroidia bacterium]|nr:hypothetical protein FACS1894201_08000 [Bacteroidia bacterium]
MILKHIILLFSGFFVCYNGISQNTNEEQELIRYNILQELLRSEVQEVIRYHRVDFFTSDTVLQLALFNEPNGRFRLSEYPDVPMEGYHGFRLAKHKRRTTENYRVTYREDPQIDTLYNYCSAQKFKTWNVILSYEADISLVLQYIGEPVLNHRDSQDTIIRYVRDYSAFGSPSDFRYDVTKLVWNNDTMRLFRIVCRSIDSTGLKVIYRDSAIVGYKAKDYKAKERMKTLFSAIEPVNSFDAYSSYNTCEFFLEYNQPDYKRYFFSRGRIRVSPKNKDFIVYPDDYFLDNKDSLCLCEEDPLCEDSLCEELIFYPNIHNVDPQNIGTVQMFLWSIKNLEVRAFKPYNSTHFR